MSYIYLKKTTNLFSLNLCPKRIEPIRLNFNGEQLNEEPFAGFLPFFESSKKLSLKF